MVGDDLDRHISLRVLSVLDVDEFAGFVHDRTEKVRLKIVGDALNDRRQPFEAHAGVYIFMGQRREVAGLVAVILHKDKVPYLKIAVAVAADRAGRFAAGKLLALVIDYLRAGAAGADRAGGPEVVIRAEAEDALLRQPDLFVPDIESLVVVKIDRRVEAVRVEADALGEKFPGPGDDLGLEVVAEAEVAQHLEECMMARRASDVLDVVRAHALLRGRRARHLRRLQTEEIRLERHHARYRKKEGRVVRHQRKAVIPFASLFLKKFQKQFA
ncbi:hypothetical protein SDC9_119398 [bioreactor metagenome]|uniref:Uncharacterized protein n=1 Tax=bioreactor metagenome TaxID=1076179 RepID=A0A645C452_9ZZZZ